MATQKPKKNAKAVKVANEDGHRKPKKSPEKSEHGQDGRTALPPTSGPPGRDAQKRATVKRILSFGAKIHQNN